MKSKRSKKYLLGFVFAAFGVLFGSHIAVAQTCDVTWRKADNPRVISGTVTIPAGQTVCAEPGVIVQSASGTNLDVYGNLLLQGTAAEPVVFSPTGNVAQLNAGIRIAGKVDAQFADISINSSVGWGGTLLVRNSRFQNAVRLARPIRWWRALRRDLFRLGYAFRFECCVSVERCGHFRFQIDARYAKRHVPQRRDCQYRRIESFY